MSNLNTEDQAILDTVRKLVIERVESAIKSGKIISQSGGWGRIKDGKCKLCAVGAIGFNGNDILACQLEEDPYGCKMIVTTGTIFALGSAALDSVGIEKSLHGLILDCVSDGFEDTPNYWLFYERAVRQDFEKVNPASFKTDYRSGPCYRGVPFKEDLCEALRELGSEIHDTYSKDD